MLQILALALAGYAAGTGIALALEMVYTGAPLRNPLPRASLRFLCRPQRGPLTRLPTRFYYLPLLGAAVAPLIAHRALDLRHALLLTLFSALLAALSATDFERHLLPNRLMYPALSAAVLLGWAWPGRTWLSTLEGGGLALLVMLAFFVAFPKLGFGDVKLSALLGLLSGTSHALPALAIGIVAGGLGALALFVSRRAGRGSLIAYGPYLALGAFAGMLMR